MWVIRRMMMMLVVAPLGLLAPSFSSLVRHYHGVMQIPCARWGCQMEAVGVPRSARQASKAHAEAQLLLLLPLQVRRKAGRQLA